MSPQRRGQGGISPGIAPSVQLYGRVTELEALVGDVEVLLDRREGHGGGIGGDLGPEPTEQLVHRHPESLPGQVVQRHVDQAEHVEGELFYPVELPDPVPQPFPPEGVLSHQLFSQAAVDEVLEDDPSARRSYAVDTTVGAYPQSSSLELGLGTG